MTERTDAGFGLIRLSDSALILEDKAQDTRGLEVRDEGGRKIGTVESLYIGE